MPVRIFPEEYNPCRLVKFGCWVLTFAQFGIIALVLGQPQAVMQRLPLPASEMIRQNKSAILMLVFFGGNVAKSIFSASNAFEIYLGRKLVFSRLEQGRMPQMEDIIRLVQLIADA